MSHLPLTNALGHPVNCGTEDDPRRLGENVDEAESLLCQDGGTPGRFPDLVQLFNKSTPGRGL